MLQDFMNIEYRKKYTEYKIFKLHDFFLSIFSDKNTAGWFSTIFLHYLPHLLFFILFLSHPFNLMFVIVWVFGFFLHIFFKGCIHLRLERALFDNKKWIGPYCILKHLGIDITKGNIKKSLYLGLTVILIIYFIKFIKHKYSNTPNNIFYINNPIFWITIFWWVIQLFGLLSI